MAEIVSLIELLVFNVVYLGVDKSALRLIGFR